jgi:hypothetical protein
MTYSLDFETYFDPELSVTTLGAHGYFETLTIDQIYLVSVVVEDGRSLVGHPRDLDWSFMAGSTIVVWNGGFEIQGLRRLREIGLAIPAPETYDLVDAADLACYVGLPRALKGAASVALGVTIDKGIRDVDMKGKGWEDMDLDLQERVKEYAIKDSEYTLQIWNKYKDQWPDNERLVSKLSREWAADGIGADVEGMKEAASKLKLTLWEAGNKLPWYNPDDPKSVPLSPKKLAEQCRDVGIPCPTSLAMDDEDCAKWEDQYGEQYPWVAAMRDYRRANALLKKIEAMATRVWGGRLRYEIKYAGANGTLRWSGGGGVNAQNLSGKSLFGVNQREYLVAPEGKMFVVSDLAQIEPRVLAWYSKEQEFLNEVAKGVSPYIVYARQTMGLGPDETWPKSDLRYKISKFAILGAGYCVGHHKFTDMLRAFGMEDVLNMPLDGDSTEEAYRRYINLVPDPTKTVWLKRFEEADEKERHWLLRSWEIIQTFRNGRPKLVALWRSLGDAIKSAASKSEDLVLELPSGRSITYRKCRFRRIPKKEGGGHDTVCDIMRNGREQSTRLHQGIAVENITQAGARDVFRDCLLRLHEHGYKVVLQVHDEAVVEVPESEAEFHRNKIEQLMSISPSWAPGLPVASEATICKKYSEAK